MNGRSAIKAAAGESRWSTPGAGFSAAVLAVALGVLLALFAWDPGPEVIAPFVFAAQAAALVLVGHAYVEDGRVQATPAFLLFAVMALYTVPVSVSFILLDFAAFADMARSAVVMTAALTGMGVVLFLFDRRRASMALAALIERHELTLRASSYGLLLAGAAWLFLLFPSPSRLYTYLFATPYYEKHIFFAGKGILSQFQMCFELAGILSALTLAIPAGRRAFAKAWDVVPLTLMTLFCVNQGFRSSIVLVFCQYLAARAFWPSNGVRVWMLAGALAVLAPVFLVWAHLRNYISSDAILATAEWSDHLSRSNWYDLNRSEIVMQLSNGQTLIDLLDRGVWEYRGGATLVIDPFFCLVPRALWPDRPDTLQIAFTHVADPTYAEGGTMGFSFALEGYLNWGMAGAVAWSAFLTWLLIRLQSVTASSARRGRLLATVWLLLLIVEFWFYLRVDFADVIRRTAIAVVLATPFVGVALSIARLHASNRFRRQPSE